MAVTCSEEARTALDLITPRSQPGVSAIHVIEASWPLQSCPIEVVLSHQRNLTLLEKYTLRAFNEIPGVSAADIADRLGLKEPELIEETLQTLQNSGAIESSITPDKDEPGGDLKEELRLIEEKLATDSYRGIVLRNILRKADILREQIRKEAPRGGNLSERMEHKIERLKRFTAKVTQLGLKHLRDGTITEPEKKEVYDLVRSLPDGGVMTTKGHEFSRKNLGREAHHWLLKKNPAPKCRHPSGEEVQLALQQVGELEGELVIQSLTPQADEQDVVYLDVCITLAVSHEDDTCRFFAHRHGTGKRLKWIEKAIAADAGLVHSILQQFEKVMPPPIKAKPASQSMIHPLVHLNRFLTAEVESGSKGMVVLNQHEKLTRLVDSSNKSLKRFLGMRTTVTLSNSKKWSLESEDVPLRFTIYHGPGDYGLSSGSIATSHGVIYPGTVVIKSSKAKKPIELPVLQFDKVLGKASVSQVGSWLRQEINSRARFLLTRNEADFARWMDERVESLDNLGKVTSVINDAEELASGTGHNVALVFFNSLFSSRKDFFKGDRLQSCMKLVETLSRHDRIEQGGWPYVEPHIQQAALESVFAGDGATDALTSKAVIDYVKTASTIISKAQSAGRHCHGGIWVSAVENRMPKQFDAVPLDLIEAFQKAPECDSGQSFRDLIQTILARSVERWVKSLPAPDSLTIPDPVQKMISRLEKLGIDDAGQNIMKFVIGKVPPPTNVSLLEEELIASTSIPEVSTPDLRTRWSRAVKDKAFTVTLDELTKIKANSLTILGSLGKTWLFRKGLDASIADVEKGDVSGVKGVCDTIKLLMEIDEAWINPVTEADGLISDRVDRRIRTGDDIITAGREVSRLMPIVDSERLPKTHARFEGIVSRGRKDSEKEKRK